MGIGFPSWTRQSQVKAGHGLKTLQSLRDIHPEVGELERRDLRDPVVVSGISVNTT